MWNVKVLVLCLACFLAGRFARIGPGLPEAGQGVRGMMCEVSLFA
jgi:hypothetical protein